MKILELNMLAVVEGMLVVDAEEGIEPNGFIDVVASGCFVGEN